jgi:hypothetical protein
MSDEQLGGEKERARVTFAYFRRPAEWLDARCALGGRGPAPYPKIGKLRRLARRFIPAWIAASTSR